MEQDVLCVFVAAVKTNQYVTTATCLYRLHSKGGGGGVMDPGEAKAVTDPGLPGR